MQMLKQLGTLIQQATNDANSEPPVNIYERVLDLINSRVDMPKHTLNGVSKRLSIKNKKVLYYCFDLLEYLSYRCELALYSQISSKEFLLKISGLLMNQELEQGVHAKILQTVRCWEELFRPHEDLLPMFFQFYAGLLRKDFPIQANYVSPHRPKDFKIYKKTQPKNILESREKVSKPVVKPTKTQRKTFEQIRQKLLLTNQIIDNVNPADGVKGNEILLQMMEQVKASEKKINQTINENPNQKIMELALAVNDDIYITYRRFKDLQKNRKPQPFILTEMVSQNESKPQTQSKKIEKVQQKPAQKSNPPPKDIFDDFEQKPKDINFQKKKQGGQIKKTAEIDIFDIACEPKKTLTETTLMDMTLQTQAKPESSNVNIFELLGNSQQIPPNNSSNNNYLSNNNGFLQPQQINPYPTNSTLNFGGMPAMNSYQTGSLANVTLNNYQTENDIQKYNSKNLIQQITTFSIDDFMGKK